MQSTPLGVPFRDSFVKISKESLAKTQESADRGRAWTAHRSGAMSPLIVRKQERKHKSRRSSATEISTDYLYQFTSSAPVIGKLSANARSVSGLLSKESSGVVDDHYHLMSDENRKGKTAGPVPGHDIFGTPGGSGMPPEKMPSRATDMLKMDEETIATGSQSTLEKYSVAILYGVINFICILPALVAYTHIVYANASRFEQYMPFLLNVCVSSSFIHQIVFNWYSSMPFAIGQVQDVGLIFLASIVKSIEKLADADPAVTDDEIVATCLWAGGIGTAITGSFVYVVGNKKWVDFVSLIPLPVIGGYLGYIGYFCVAAGLTIVVDEQISTPDTWLLILNPDYYAKLAVFVIMLAMLLVIHFRFNHYVFLMPFVMLVMPVAFIAACVIFGGASVADLRASGWIPYPSASAVWGYKQFSLYDPSMVHWSFVPSQILNIAGLIIVVTFGSSLDIAAIQAELPYRLDFNKEMCMIGKSNFLAGFTGGWTGSYIFSQTVFSLKSKVNSKVCGVVIIIFLVILWVLPIDLLCVLPKPYVAAIVALFGVDIMLDWLWKSRKLLSSAEYGIVWLAFAFIMVLQGEGSFGLIGGMVMAISAAATLFTLYYARLPVWIEYGHRSSSTFRKHNERLALERYKDMIFVAKFRGYIFFGSSMDITSRLEGAIMERNAQLKEFSVQASRITTKEMPSASPGVTSPLVGNGHTTSAGQAAGKGSTSPTGGKGTPTVDSVRVDFVEVVNPLDTSMMSPSKGSGMGQQIRPERYAPRRLFVNHNIANISANVSGILSDGNPNSTLLSEEISRPPSPIGNSGIVAAHEYSGETLMDAVRYLILDLSGVQDVDSTACVAFSSLKIALRNFDDVGIQVYFSGIRNDRIRKLLVANGVLEESEGPVMVESSISLFDSQEEPPEEFHALEEALMYVEEQILNQVLPPEDNQTRYNQQITLPLETILKDYFVTLGHCPGTGTDDDTSPRIFSRSSGQLGSLQISASAPAESASMSALARAAVNQVVAPSQPGSLPSDAIQISSSTLNNISFSIPEHNAEGATSGVYSIEEKLSQLATFADEMVLQPGEILFRSTDRCTSVFFVSKGVVHASFWKLGKHSNVEDHLRSNGSNGVPGGYLNKTSPSFDYPEISGRENFVQHQCQNHFNRTSRQGALLGNISFAYGDLNMTYGYDSWAGSNGCILYRFSRARVRLLEKEHPDLVLLLQKIFLREICFDALREFENSTDENMNLMAEV